MVQYFVARCLHCSFCLAVVAPAAVLSKEETYLDFLFFLDNVGYYSSIVCCLDFLFISITLATLSLYVTIEAI